MNDKGCKDNWFELSWSESKLMTGKDCLTKDTLAFSASTAWLRRWAHCENDLGETVLVLLSALPISLLSFFFLSLSRIVYYPWHYDSVHRCNLTWVLNLFQPRFFFFFLPTGGGWRRRFSGADRDIFPQQAHAKGCEEPAGRRCCPMPGICARTFSEWGSGGWRSQSPFGNRYQHLRWIRRWAVRHWYHRQNR